MDAKNNKGWIALDIDGTITHTLHEMPRAVASYLKKVVGEGWKLMFVTGRIFSFAHHVLKALDFPYYVAVQNGADIVRMPMLHPVCKNYLPKGILASLEKAYEGTSEDFIVYAGFERGDFCYFRPKRFSPPVLDYLQVLKQLCSEPWKEVEDFSELRQEEFPLIKCFGEEMMMRSLYANLKSVSGIHATLIRDMVCPGLYLILITAPDATKGHAIDRILACEEGGPPIIAAGDDCNDIELLDRADIKIVMETAPQELLDLADIIAPAAAKCGIIEGLEKAIHG